MCSPLAELRPGRNNPCKRSTARQPRHLLPLRIRPTMNFLLVDAFNAPGHQMCATPAHENTMRFCTLPPALQTPPCRPSPEQTFRKCLRTCQPHPHELESGIFFFFMEQSKMEIHNDIQANPHPPCLILLELSKKSPVY